MFSSTRSKLIIAIALFCLAFLIYRGIGTLIIVDWKNTNTSKDINNIQINDNNNNNNNLFDEQSEHLYSSSSHRRSSQTSRTPKPSKTTTTTQRTHNYVPPNMCHKFILISGQRSGTHWFMSLFSHIQFYTKHLAHEVFHNQNSYKKNSTGQHILMREELDFRRGFIVQYNQMRKFRETFPFVVQNQIPVVHLIRDPFNTVFSDSFHVLENSSHCMVNTTCENSGHKIELNATRFFSRMLERCLLIRDAQTKLKTHPEVPSIEIRYEDVAHNIQYFCNEVVEKFLNCSCGNKLPTSNFVPVHSQAYRELVTNYDEFKAQMLYLTRNGAEGISSEDLELIQKSLAANRFAET